MAFPGTNKKINEILSLPERLELSNDEIKEHESNLEKMLENAKI